MSDNIHNDANISALEVEHTCEQCGKLIEKGQPAVHSHGVYYGDKYDYHTHSECLAAANAWASETGLWGEEFPWFQHMDETDYDHDWMLENHPIVATRLGIADRSEA